MARLIKAWNGVLKTVTVPDRWQPLVRLEEDSSKGLYALNQPPLYSTVSLIARTYRPTSQGVEVEMVPSPLPIVIHYQNFAFLFPQLYSLLA